MLLAKLEWWADGGTRDNGVAQGAACGCTYGTNAGRVAKNALVRLKKTGSVYFPFNPFQPRYPIGWVVRLTLGKDATLRIILNIDGTPITSKSHTHPSHSQTSRLLTLSLSLGVPVPRGTQCQRDT